MPTYLTQCIRINAPKGFVWDLIKEFEAIADLVQNGYFKSTGQDSESIARIQQIMPGVRLLEEQIQIEQDHFYVAQMNPSLSSGPFQAYKTKLWVRHLDNEHCELQFSCLYDLKMKPFSNLINTLMIKEKCSRDGKRLLKDIKKASETQYSQKKKKKLANSE